MAASSAQALHDTLLWAANLHTHYPALDAAQHAVRASLYLAASGDGAHWPALAPQCAPASLPTSYAQIRSEATAPRAAWSRFYDELHAAGGGVPVHTGRPCARKFRAGEAIYRCSDCGADDTCVLCTHCFSPRDHENHAVSVSIASASNEGICDCGDPEAWTVPVHCRCDESAATEGDATGAHGGAAAGARTELGSDVRRSMTLAVQTALDYVIGVMLHQNHTLPAVHDFFKASYNLEHTVAAASEALDDPATHNTDTYCLVLWNDEFHDYPDATSRIQAVLKCSAQRSQEVAMDVDRRGRTVLQVSADLAALVSAYYVVQRTGLTATIHSLRDVMKQEVAKFVVDWLQEMVDSPASPVASVFRSVFCEVVTAKFDNTAVRTPYYQTVKADGLSDASAFRDGLTTADNRIPAGGLVRYRHQQLDVSSLKGSAHELLAEDHAEQITGSRLQYLLYFDLRFWKEFRKCVHNIVTPVLVGDLAYKPVFAKQFVQIYPHLLHNQADLDREWLLNVLNDATVQLFTCPKTSLMLLTSGALVRIVGPIVDLFEKNRSIKTHNDDTLWKMREILSNQDRHSRAVWYTERKAVRDLVQLIDHPAFTAEHLCVFETRNFVLLVFFLKRFQSNWKIRRKEGEHVLRESKEFSSYFELNCSVYDLVGTLSAIVAKVDTAGAPQQARLAVQDAVVILANYLELRTTKERWIDQGFFNIFEFKVSKQETGFMNPLNSLLSFMMESAKITDLSLLDSKVTSFTWDEVHRVSNYSDFLKVSDLSLRSIVLCAQINAGFWVRNGMLVGRQAAIYSQSFFSELGLSRDLHLQQLSIMTEPSFKRSFFNFLDRFELLDWFLNREPVEGTCYDDKVYYIFEEFVTFLYHVYTTRLAFSVDLSTQDKERATIRSLICYSLCQGPSAYSALCDRFSSTIAAHPAFEELLHEVAEYKPPQGLNDTGLYRLKGAVFNELDPLSFFAESADMAEISSCIRQELAHSKTDEIVLKPQLMEIRDAAMAKNFRRVHEFFRTANFAKFLYKLLQTAIDTDNETFLPAALHLLHAIVLDDQFDVAAASGAVAGAGTGDASLKAFNDIPIANLLMTISESASISKSNISKADSILDLLVLRDADVLQTLVDCFGEEHVAAYKAMKADRGGLETRDEKARRLARERAEKIKKKFERQQRKFAVKNESALHGHHDRDGDVAMDAADPALAAAAAAAAAAGAPEARTCILCQTEDSGKELFGIPCYVNKSPVFWQFPVDVDDAVVAAFENWNAEDELFAGAGQNQKKRRRESSFVNAWDEFVDRLNATPPATAAVFDDDLDGEDDSDADSTTDIDHGPVEVRFDERFADSHGNLLNGVPAGAQNYISSLAASRRESVDSADGFQARFGNSVASRYVINSCNHGMHYKCFNEYLRKPNSFKFGFQCPLCRTLNNFFLPSFKRPADAEAADASAPAAGAAVKLGALKTGSGRQFTKYNQLITDVGQDNCCTFREAFVDDATRAELENLTPAGKQMFADLARAMEDDVILEDICSEGSVWFNRLQALSILVGNSVQTAEITARFTTGSEAFGGAELRASQRDLVVSLVQTRSVLEYFTRATVSASGATINPSPIKSVDVDRMWMDSYANMGMFTEFAVLVHQSGASVQTTARATTTKMFAVVLDSVLQRCMAADSFKKFVFSLGAAHRDAAEDLTCLRDLIVDQVHPTLELPPDLLQLVANYDVRSANAALHNTFLVGVDVAVLRFALPFFRQLYVFLKALDPSVQIDAPDLQQPKAAQLAAQVSQVCRLVGVADWTCVPQALMDHGTAASLEQNVFSIILESKVPKFLEDGILALDDPGVIRLKRLPARLGKFLEQQPEFKSQYSICLLCGSHIYTTSARTLSDRVIRHFHKDCDKSRELLSVFFNPFSNLLTIILQLQTPGAGSRNRVLKYTLSSPYLNKHGEAYFKGGSFNGILNQDRYNELNKLWLNQGIYAFLSRLTMDSATVADFTDPFTTTTFRPDDFAAFAGTDNDAMFF